MLPSILPPPHSLKTSRTRDKRVNSDPSAEPNVPLFREGERSVDDSPRVYDAGSDQAALAATADAHSNCLPAHSLRHTAASCCTALLRLPASAWSLPWRVRVLWAVSALAIVDHFLFPPHGLLPLRRLTGWPDHSSPRVCGWDYEASWKVGLARGSSPSTLRFDHSDSASNPILTCADVPSPAVSFVADPFLLLVDAHNRPLAQPLHNEHTQPHTALTDAAASAVPSNTATAASARTAQPYRAYLFYEMKNLHSMLGEIGVALSSPHGSMSHGSNSSARFAHVGTALSEPFHLSYPLPLYHPESGSYLLIPECHQTLSVRIYRTSADAFPFDWQVQSVPLQGRHFVDTSPVHYRGLWYVFTTVSSQLLLYTTPDLLDPTQWAPHPLSPLQSFNWRTSRSAGRPVIHDGRVVRFAQDDSAFYGMAVYAIEVVELSPTAYSERQVAVVRPHTMTAQGSQWGSARLHHMDVKRTGDGEWLAVVDGDDNIPNYEFWQREGWWRVVKDAVTVGLLAVAVYLTLLHWRRLRPQTRLAYTLTASPVTAVTGLCRAATSVVVLGVRSVRRSLRSVSLRDVARVFGVAALSLALVLFVIAPLYAIRCGESCGYDLHGERIVKLQQHESSLSVPLPPDVSARFNLSAFPSSPASLATTALIDSLSAFTYPDSSASFALPALPAHPPLPPLPAVSSAASFPQPFVPFPGFVVLTAASSSYFDRLQNFVGSIHFWEPSQRVLVFDLGLTAQQAAAIHCWHNVELRPFQFELYPQHVRNLYNYAWKPLMLEQAFALPGVSAVLLLDSGAELRAPHGFSDIKRALMERGYWFARQAYNVEQRTMPSMFAKLGIDVASVAGQPFCAGGLHGFLKGSAAYHEVAMAAFECAKDEECIAPVGSGRMTHNFDQSVMSALIYATGRYCDARRGYREEWMSSTTADEADANADVVLLLRRWHQPKPYVRHIRGVLSAQCPFIHPSARPLIEYPPSASIDSIAFNASSHASRAQMERLLIQHKDGQHLQSDSPLVLCLHQHRNSRYACRAELTEHQRAVVETMAAECKTPSAWVDLNLVPIARLLRCGSTWLLAANLFALLWWTPTLIRHATATWLRVAVLSAALSCLLLHPLLVALLDSYGTSLSLVVSLHTSMRTPPSEYPAQSQSFSASPSTVPVRPGFPLVLSLSPLPHQLASLNLTLDSLAGQSLRPDAIHVNLPRTQRSLAYSEPSSLAAGSWAGIPLHVHRSDDAGSLLQTALTLRAVTDPATLVIAVEGGLLYPASLTAHLAYHAQFDDSAALGSCGWSFLFRPAPVGVTPIHIPASMRGQFGRHVDVLQSACGVAYRRGWFPPAGSAEFDELSAPHPHCVAEPDMWLAGWLATRTNVSHAVLPLSEGSGEWPVWHTQSEPGVDMMCIRAVEQTLGPWREHRADRARVRWEPRPG